MGIIKLNKKGENKVTQQNNTAEKKENKKLSKAGGEIAAGEPAKEIELCELAKQDAGFVEELENLRTANETVYRRNDRTCRKIITAKPTRYLDENGKYRDISNRLSDNGNEIENEANSFKVKFNKDATNGKIFDLQKGKKVVSLSAVSSVKTRSHSCGCKCELCSDKEDTVLATLDDGTKIEYLTQNDRIKENIIINEKCDKYEYYFTLNIGDLTVEEGNNSSLLLKDAQTGELQFTIPAPYMYDANKVRSNDVSYEIDVNGEELQIKVVANTDFINAEERVLPVIIDPQIVLCYGEAFSYYTESYQEGNGENDELYGYMYVYDIGSSIDQIFITINKNEIETNEEIEKVILQLTAKPDFQGSFIVQNVNHETYQFEEKEYRIDITQLYKNHSGAFTFNIWASTNSYGSFYTEGDNVPKLVISYVSNEEKNKKKFELGDKSKVILDLNSGESVAEIADIIVGNNLPLQINHLHKLGVDETEYGFNWRLNFNKKLCISEDDTSKTTRYIYTDELGDKYLFEEKYYYINDGIKVPVEKDKIKIDINGDLYYGANQVYKYQYCKDYTLIPETNDFINSEFIEQRQEQQIQLEEYVLQYKPTLLNYVRASAYTGSIQYKLKTLTKVEFELLFGGIGSSSNYIILTESDAIQLQTLKANISQVDMQLNQLNMQQRQLTFQKEQIEHQKSQINGQKIDLNNTIRLGDAIYPNECDDNISFIVNKEETYKINKIREQMSYQSANRSLAALNTSLLDADTQKSFLTEQETSLAQQITALNTQKAQLNAQKDLLVNNARNSFEIIKQSFLNYFSKQAELDLLNMQTPVNFIRGKEGIINGFNKNGDLVYICDSYNNNVWISYDNNEYITKISENEQVIAYFEYENGKLKSITDNCGRKVEYEYDGKKLIGVTYPDGEKYAIKYSSNRLASITLDSGTQWKMSYNDDGKLSTLMEKRVAPNSGTVWENGFDYQLKDSGEPYLDISYSDGATETYEFNMDSKLVLYRHKDGAKFVKQDTYSYDTNETGKIITKETRSDPSFSKVTKITEQYNDINLLVSKIEDWQDISEEYHVKTETLYDYDTANNLISEITTTFTAEKSEEDEDKATKIKRVVNYNYNAQCSLVLTESYIEGEELTSGIIYNQNVYDKNGNVVQTISWNSLDSSSRFYEQSDYSENGQVISDRDETGEISAEYNYRANSNTLNEIKFPNGSKLAYGRNAYNDVITSVTQSSENGESNTTNLVYEYGQPVQVKSGNTVIDYTYDCKGRQNSVTINGNLQAEYSYEDFKRITPYDDVQYLKKSCTLKVDGENIKSVYLKEGELDADIYRFDTRESLTVKNDRLYLKYYNTDGVLEYISYKADTEYKINYEYDGYHNMTKAETKANDIIVLTENYSYNEYGELTGKTISNAVAHTYSYAYKNNAARDLDHVGFGNFKFYPLSDVNGRNTGKEIYNGSEKIAAEYITYRKVGDHATNMPATVWFGGGNAIKDSIKYKYDSCGNICQITENGHLTAKYTYDSLNRLIREDNKAIDKTVLYTYDNNGNIVERCEYEYTSKTGEELSELECEHYSYDYDGDKLVSYNGESFVYNNLGNPTTYRNKSVTWQYGKYLASYNGTAFTYDGLGRRVTKGGITFTYDNENNLIKQSNGLEFIYDDKGVVGVKYNGAQYFYRKDAQGNIIAILDSNGAVVVKYVYDAWGNHEVLNSDGTDCESGIGILNPFRYRGYYYDTETDLYYLQTRYYDPEVGRFISQDSIEYADPETINGLNLYAYCGNNPTNYLDPTGNAEWYQWFLSSVLTLGGAILCFIPGAQGVGAALLVSGISMTASNAMSSAGVDNKTASIISSGIDIIAGIVLCFTPLIGLGASFIGSGVGGIAGGYISESVGGSFELGSNIGSLIGSLVGGKIYEELYFSHIAKQGILIGKMGRFETAATEMGLAFYKGLPGYSVLSKIAPNLTSQLGWAHNYNFIYNVMKRGGTIYNLGGALTGSYAKEISLLWRFLYRHIKL